MRFAAPQLAGPLLLQHLSQKQCLLQQMLQHPPALQPTGQPPHTHTHARCAVLRCAVLSAHQPCRSLSTVRVMVVTRSAFESIERNFPIASRLVLENLKRRSEAQVCWQGGLARVGACGALHAD